VDNRDEVKAFLTSRRAKITPEQAGLSPSGRSRRVPGLRRSEVADLAGVSVEYYAQLERGDLAGASEAVLEALARALQLDEAERAHLNDLARAAGPGSRTRRGRRKEPAQALRPSVARLLELMDRVPVIVNNARSDLVAANPLGRALFAPVLTSPLARPARASGAPLGRSASPVNHARFTFLDDRARDFWTDWERAANDSVAQLRTEAGRDPYDKDLTDLVGELSTRSEAFRTRWAAHDVRLHRTGLKHIHHPVVGDLHLDFDVLEPPDDPGLSLVAFSAAAGTPDDDALTLLANWATTHNPADVLA
jgi:transcriptional regulator with XRE-family HTH domain